MAYVVDSLAKRSYNKHIHTKEHEMTVTATPEQIPSIVAEAESAAHAAADQYFRQELGGRDQFACGFAWVKIYGVKGNTKIGRALKATGIRPSYSGGLEMWNPSKFGCQNVDTLEAGARAAAAVFEKYGFEAYAGSRLD